MELEQNFIENSLIILTKQTCDLLLSQEKGSDLIALYVFYYYTAKWQGTNQPHCTTSYSSDGLGWTIQRLRKAKKKLIELGLISDVKTFFLPFYSFGEDWNKKIIVEGCLYCSFPPFYCLIICIGSFFCSFT